jgi:hypothetical protein
VSGLGSDALADICDREARFKLWLDQVRAGDPAFAEASALYPWDMGEWQAAVYLLTGCGEVWRALGAPVLAERSLGPVVAELQSPRRPWAASEDAVMEWAAHFWDVDRSRVKFPYVFQRFYLQRWIVACHLRQRIPLDPSIAGGGGR